MPDRVPDWLLERYAAGALSPEEADDVRARLKAEPDGEQRLAELRRSDEEIRLQYPARDLLPGIKERAGVRPARRPWVVLVPVLALAAALLLVFVGLPSGPDDPDILLKGADPALRVYKKVDGGAEQLSSGTHLEAGDTVQLAYRAGVASHGVIVSIDGAGAVTLHFPDDPSADTALAPEGEVRLPTAYKLDDAPDFERFFLVFDDEPLAVRTVLQAAEQLAASDRAVSDPLPIQGRWIDFGVDK